MRSSPLTINQAGRSYSHIETKAWFRALKTHCVDSRFCGFLPIEYGMPIRKSKSTPMVMFLAIAFGFCLISFTNCGKFVSLKDGLNGQSIGSSPNGPTPTGLPPMAPPPADEAFCASELCLAPGTPTVRSTLTSLGVELPVTKDTNHNATVEVRYKRTNETGWRMAMSLVRIDFKSTNGRVTNALNGSVISLESGQSYDLHLIIREPDGGVKNIKLQASTKAMPKKQVGGKIYHVRPSGTSAGDGSSGSPFNTVALADAAAAPGDMVLLHAGNYASGLIELKKSGQENNYIIYQIAGDGEVTFGHTDIYASYIWLEGITFRNQPFAIVGKRDVAEKDVVISRCKFLENHYAIHIQTGSLATGWIIMDNLIDGDNKTMNGSFDGEAIEMNQTSDHTVMYNTITHVADGISYPGANVDIFANDIFNVTDDLVEVDEGLANVRVIGNRLHNGNNNGFSFQPQESGPWYFIKNQMIGIRESYIKFRNTDRFVFVHNTIVGWDHIDLSNEDNWVSGPNNLTSAIAKNNLFVVATNGKPMAFANNADVRFNWRSELDYNGYEWGNEVNPFRYAGISYSDVAAFFAATGMEKHGVRIRKEECFENLGITGPVPSPIADVRLTLKSSCKAIDAGLVLPNINDGYQGIAPDLGALESGATVPHVGIRP